MQHQEREQDCQSSSRNLPPSLPPLPFVKLITHDRGGDRFIVAARDIPAGTRVHYSSKPYVASYTKKGFERHCGWCGGSLLNAHTPDDKNAPSSVPLFLAKVGPFRFCSADCRAALIKFLSLNNPHHSHHSHCHPPNSTVVRDNAASEEVTADERSQHEALCRRRHKMSDFIPYMSALLVDAVFSDADVDEVFNGNVVNTKAEEEKEDTRETVRCVRSGCAREEAVNNHLKEWLLTGVVATAKKDQGYQRNRGHDGLGGNGDNDGAEEQRTRRRKGTAKGEHLINKNSGKNAIRTHLSRKQKEKGEGEEEEEEEGLPATAHQKRLTPSLLLNTRRQRATVATRAKGLQHTTTRRANISSRIKQHASVTKQLETVAIDKWMRGCQEENEEERGIAGGGGAWGDGRTPPFSQVGSKANSTPSTRSSLEGSVNDDCDEEEAEEDGEEDNEEREAGEDAEDRVRLYLCLFLSLFARVESEVKGVAEKDHNREANDGIEIADASYLHRIVDDHNTIAPIERDFASKATKAKQLLAEEDAACRLRAALEYVPFPFPSSSPLLLPSRNEDDEGEKGQKMEENHSDSIDSIVLPVSQQQAPLSPRYIDMAGLITNFTSIITPAAAADDDDDGEGVDSLSDRGKEYARLHQICLRMRRLIIQNEEEEDGPSTSRRDDDKDPHQEDAESSSLSVSDEAVPTAMAEAFQQRILNRYPFLSSALSYSPPPSSQPLSCVSMARRSQVIPLLFSSVVPRVSFVQFAKMCAALQCNGFGIYETLTTCTAHSPLQTLSDLAIHTAADVNGFDDSRHSPRPPLPPSLPPPHIADGINNTNTNTNNSTTPCPCVAIAFYPFASYFNHACAPNLNRIMTAMGPKGERERERDCHHHHTDAADCNKCAADAPCDDASPQLYKVSLTFVTSRDVRMGDALTIAYVKSEEGDGDRKRDGHDQEEEKKKKIRRQRRDKLFSTYRFHCNCEDCARGGEFL